MTDADLHLGRTRTERSDKEAGSNPLVAAVSRLVPHSGVQFIDIAIGTRSLSATVGKFVEDVDPEDGCVLVPLNDQPDCDGVEWHPITGERLAPSQTLWVSGYQALEPFLGVWLPLPYLRFSGRDADGELRFDDGPMNWVRIYIEQPAEGLRDAESLKAVLAIDTTLEKNGRIGQDDYLAPNTDDVVFAPVFKLASDPIHIAEFTAASWFDEGLARSYASFEKTQAAAVRPSSSAAVGGATQRASSSACKPPPAPKFTHERTARYLALLAVLQAESTMPQLQFVDRRTTHWKARNTPVELMLDIDSAFTSAALLLSKDAPAASKTICEPLRLRDLSRPTVTHNAPIRTIAEFSQPNFGDERASLLSGRTDAFNWPSLVRVGDEALRISQAAGAAPGQTGLHAVMRGLRQTTPNTEVWRFARADGAKPTHAGAMVSGRVMSHLAEDGSVIKPGDVDAAPALRPHFSPSALLSMFIAECLLHAISSANAPAAIHESNHIRTLKRVVLTCPIAATVDERAMLLKRAQDARDLIWSANGWDSANELTPEPPEIVLTFDVSVASQIAFLDDEITHRFSGDSRRFLELVGRADFGQDDSAAAASMVDAMRIATLDLSGQATTLTVVNYSFSAEGGIAPMIECAERSSVAGDTLTEAVMKSHILPAIADGLDEAGHPDGAALLMRAGNLIGSNAEFLGRHFSACFLRKVLLPATTALIDLHQAVADGTSGNMMRRFTIGHLVRLGDGRMGPLDEKLEALAAREGARSFRLDKVEVTLDPHAVSATIASHLSPMLDQVVQVVSNANVDLFVLSGQFADLPDVTRSLEAKCPLAPHRIVNLNRRYEEASVEPQASDIEAPDPRLITLARATLSGGNDAGKFNAIGALADELRLAAPKRTGLGLLEPDSEVASRRYIPWSAQEKAQVLPGTPHKPHPGSAARPTPSANQSGPGHEGATFSTSAPRGEAHESPPARGDVTKLSKRREAQAHVLPNRANAISDAGSAVAMPMTKGDQA